MASAATFRVTGYRECMRALNKIDRDIGKEVRGALKEAAEPIAADIRGREVWQGASVGTIGPKVTTTGVFITQRARKVTGQRPDYGVLQMVQAFMPGLEANVDLTEREVLQAYDSLVRRAGFH